MQSNNIHHGVPCATRIAQLILLVSSTLPASAQIARIDGDYKISSLADADSVGGSFIGQYESYSIATPNGNDTHTLSVSFRCGAHPGVFPPPGNGTAYWDVPVGTYSMFATRQRFYNLGVVISGVTHGAGGTARDLVPGTAYSFFPDLNQAIADQTPAYGVYAQSFRANGSSLLRASTKHIESGKAVAATVTVHRMNGDTIDPTVIGPSRTVTIGFGDSWVGWSHGEVPLQDGAMYCVQWSASEGWLPWTYNSDPINLGRMYHDGIPDYGRDMGAYIGVATNVTVSMCAFNRGETDNGDNMDFGTLFGQTWQAKGTSLAGIAFSYSSGLQCWSGDCAPPNGGGGDFARIRATIYSQAPAGGAGPPPVSAKWGPSKITWGHGSDSDHLFSWSEDEVVLTPGSTYYVLFESLNSSLPAYWRNGDYPGGQAFVNNDPKAGRDLALEIYEYTKNLQSPAPVPPEEPPAPPGGGTPPPGGGTPPPGGGTPPPGGGTPPPGGGTQPDFECLSTGPTSAYTGSAVTLTVTLRNNGAPSEPTAVQFILDACVDGASALPEPCGTPVKTIGTANVPALGTGESATVTTGWTPTAGDVGTYDYWAWVNNGGAPESNTNNNICVVTMTVSDNPGNNPRGNYTSGGDGGSNSSEGLKGGSCFAAAAGGGSSVLALAVLAAAAVTAVRRRSGR